MKKLNLFRLELTLESPLLVGFTAPSHNFYETLNFIPSITLRGALGTETLEHFCVKKNGEFGKCEFCTQANICEFYKFFYQNTFSITNGIFRNKLDESLEKKKDESQKCEGHDIIPPHPLLQICKVCRKDQNKKDIIKITNNLPKWLISPYFFSSCPICYRKTTMQPSKNYYCRNCKKSFGTPETGITTSTSINYKKGSSLKSYLYQYNYIQSENVFESYIMFENNDLMLDFLKNLTFLRIGRGKSRGFGKVSIKLEKCDLNKKIDRNKKLIKEMVSRKKLLIAAKTNIFSMQIETSQNRGLISKPVIDLNEASHWIKKELNQEHTSLGDKFSLKNSLGSTNIISGWSFKTEQPKPHINTAVPGSIYMFSIPDNNIDDNIIKTLAYLEFIGLNKYSRLGYNLVYFPSLLEVPDHE